jgi:predicted Zn finger-like uncharacterized protein
MFGSEHSQAMARARVQRRQLERERKKLVAAKWKLASFEPGYRADRPIAVESASQIEPHVRGMRCPGCDASYQVVEHLARSGARVVRAKCAQCGRSPEIHFVLRERLPS